MRLGVFLERDGILNHVRVERNQPVSPTSLNGFEVKQEAIAPLAKLKAAGFLLIATTNQPGISRGQVFRAELDQMHALLRQTFALDDILVCPHDEADRCPCRKPMPGLLVEAGFKWHLTLERSFVLSDRWQDVQAARAAGCSSVAITSPFLGTARPDFSVADLDTAVEKILQPRSGKRLATV